MPIPCDSCKALIAFVESAKKDPKTGRGKRIPVDAVAVVKVDTRDPFGEQAKIVTADGRVVSGAVLKEGAAIDRAPGDIEEGRPSHFATCPHANKHRKGRKR